MPFDFFFCFFIFLYYFIYFLFLLVLFSFFIFLLDVLFLLLFFPLFYPPFSFSFYVLIYKKNSSSLFPFSGFCYFNLFILNCFLVLFFFFVTFLVCFSYSVSFGSLETDQIISSYI